MVLVALIAVIFVFAAWAWPAAGNNEKPIRCIDCNLRQQYLFRTGQMTIPICPCCGDFGYCEDQVVHVFMDEEAPEEFISQIRESIPWMCDECVYAFADAFLLPLSDPAWQGFLRGHSAYELFGISLEDMGIGYFEYGYLD